MNLSPNFTLEEFIRSDYAIRHGIDNAPSPDVVENLTALAQNVLEPLRLIVKKPIRILSGYRCPELNKGIGGATNSQHIEGKAADIIVPQITVNELFELTRKFTDHDQVIQEFDRWTHVSYNGKANRKQSLWAVKENGKTVYLPTAPARSQS